MASFARPRASRRPPVTAVLAGMASFARLRRVGWLRSRASGESDGFVRAPPASRMASFARLRRVGWLRSRASGESDGFVRAASPLAAKPGPGEIGPVWPHINARSIAHINAHRPTARSYACMLSILRRKADVEGRAIIIVKCQRRSFSRPVQCHPEPDRLPHPSSELPKSATSIRRHRFALCSVNRVEIFAVEARSLLADRARDRSRCGDGRGVERGSRAEPSLRSVPLRRPDRPGGRPRNSRQAARDRNRDDHRNPASNGNGSPRTCRSQWTPG
jgi:hypothetical protein